MHDKIVLTWWEKYQHRYQNWILKIAFRDFVLSNSRMIWDICAISWFKVISDNEWISSWYFISDHWIAYSWYLLIEVEEIWTLEIRVSDSLNRFRWYLNVIRVWSYRTEECSELFEGLKCLELSSKEQILFQYYFWL